ncbi:MAG: hypothetical protein ACOCP8_08785 [archaeon]
MNDLNYIITEIEELLDENIENIGYMIEKTEKHYTQISERLPEIEREIDNTIEETNILITYFINPESGESVENDEKHLLFEIISELENNINQAHRSLINSDEIINKLSTFLEENKNNKLQFNNIQNLIESVQYSLKTLKNLSINASIHAFHIGEKGSAFKVVAGEINKFSKQVSQKYNYLDKKVTELEEWYQKFKTNIHDIVQFEKKLGQDFKKKIETMMSDILSSLKSVTGLLEDFMKQINWGVEPIQNILVLIQNQDIIKQNMENLIKIMDKSKNEARKYGNQEKLNNKESLIFLNFMHDSLQLSSRLVSNILEQLDNSLFAIGVKFNEIENRLNHIMNDNDFLTNYLTRDQTPAEISSGMDFIYRDIMDFIPYFKDNLKIVTGKYEVLIDYNFQSNLENVSNIFDQLHKTADLFKIIRILAKLELTKINRNDKFIDSFEKTINKFFQTTIEEQKIFNLLKKNLKNDYNNFITLARQNKKNIETSFNSISNSHQQLNLTKDLIQDAIQALNSSMGNLSQKIILLNDEIKKCFKLKDTAQQIINSLKDCSAEINEIKEDKSSELNIDNPEKTNEHLQGLIEEFTSFVERKTAKEEFDDLEFDVGSKEGELTLF